MRRRFALDRLRLGMVHRHSSINLLLLDIFIIFLIISVGFCLAYYFPMQSQTWDSLMNSLSARIAGYTNIQADHPLSNLILDILFKAVAKIFPTLKALDYFLFLNAIFYGVCGGLFYYLSVILIKDRYFSLLGSVLLLNSSVFWHYSKTAELYMLVALFNIFFLIALHLFIRKADFQSSILLGLISSVSVLIHRANLIQVLISLVILVFLFTKHKISVSVIYYFILTTTLTLLTGFFVFAILSGNNSLNQGFNWFGGYLSESNLEVGTQSGRGLQSIIEQFLKSSSTIIISEGFPKYIYIFPRIFFVLFLVAGQLYFGFLLFKNNKDRDWIYYLGVFAIWIAGAVSILWGLASQIFGPGEKKYWILFLPSFLVTFIYAVDNLRKPNLLKTFIRIIFLVGCVGLFIYNFKTEIYSNYIAKNQQQEASIIWKEKTQYDDLIIMGSEEIVPYLRFIGWINVLYIPQLIVNNESQSEMVVNLIEAKVNDTLRSGSKVFVTSDIREGVLEFYPQDWKDIAENTEEMLSKEFHREFVFDYEYFNQKIKVYYLSEIR